MVLVAICTCTILLIQIGKAEKLMRAENGGDEKQVIDLEWPFITEGDVVHCS